MVKICRGEFYCQSYLVNPKGEIEKQANRDKGELIVHDRDMDLIREIRKNWLLFRDRRVETYDQMIELN